MKKCLFALLFSTLFFAAQSQNHGHVGDLSDHTGYSFMITEGVNSPTDAAMVDSLLLSLKDMVLFSKTDPITKVCQVRVQDPRVVYASIYDFLIGKGYKPTKEFSSIE